MKTLIIIAALLAAPLAHALTVQLGWDANTDSAIGYKVCFGRYSGNVKVMPFANCSTVVGRADTTKTIGGISDKMDTYFRVKAYNSFMDSEYSNMVRIDVVRTPTNLKFQSIQIR